MAISDNTKTTFRASIGLEIRMDDEPRGMIFMDPGFDRKRNEEEMLEAGVIPYPQAHETLENQKKSLKQRFLNLCAWVDSWALPKQPK